MNRTQTILRNIVSNWLGYVVQAAVVFFLTPYVLRELGDARYGAWALITSVTGTYGLLAFGLQGGVNQYLTRYLANRDYRKMNEVASTATALLALVGVGILLMSVIVAALFPYIFDVPEELTQEVRLCTVIVGASVAAQMSLFIFSSIFMATQRYDLSSSIGVATRLLSAGLVVLALKSGSGIVGISAATAASNIVDYVLRCIISYRLVPQLEVRIKFISRPAFADIFHFGAWSFLISIAGSIFSYSDSIIIGAMLPISYLAPYSLAAGLIRQLESLLRPVDQVFYPALTHLHAEGELASFRSMYLRGSRLFLIVVAIATVLAACWAKDFFRLWVGERFLSGEEFPSVATLFLLLLSAMSARLLSGLGGQALLAGMLVKHLAIIVLLEAICNVMLSVVLIHKFGLVGVAVGTIIPAIVFRTLAIPFTLGVHFEVPLRVYLKESVLRAAILAFLFWIIAVCIRQLGEADSFVMLLAQGLGAIAIAGPLALFVGMNRTDREQFIYRPVVAMRKRFITDAA